MKPLLTFAHITDTHVGQTPEFTRYGYPSLPALERLIDILNGFPVSLDFVIHTGDLSHDQSAKSYALAARTLARLEAPVYFVNGNHDRPAMLREYMGAPAHPSTDPAAPLDYVFDVRGERFLVLDAQNAAVPDPQGKLRDSQLAFAQHVIEDTPGPLTVLLHYPLFPMNSPWLDAHMLVENGAALHTLLLPIRDRLRGVFLGHMHRSCQIHRDGIVYTCAGSTFAQYAWHPWDELPKVDPDSSPAYNYVQYFQDQVIVHQYGFQVGG